MPRTGLLGRKLGHSYSPRLHALYGDNGYRLFEVEPEAVADFLHNGPFDALNVTIPYKKDAAQACAELSPTARATGSVNTVVRLADGKLLGDNTDAFGFAYAFSKLGIPMAGKKALVLGSGGAAATVRHVLSELGAKPVTISRQGPNNYGNLARHADAHLIVNATPVGMYPHCGEAPLSLRGFPLLEAVFDLVYNPARTILLKEAEKLGVPCANGLLMLVAQAHRSREIFENHAIDQNMIEEVFREMLDFATGSKPC